MLIEYGDMSRTLSYQMASDFDDLRLPSTAQVSRSDKAPVI